MKVKVTYLSIIKDAIGVDEETLEMKEGSTIGELLSALLAKHGDCMKQFMDPSSEMGQSIMVMMNGELLSSSDMGRTITVDAEILVGLPPFGG